MSRPATIPRRAKMGALSTGIGLLLLMLFYVGTSLVLLMTGYID